jgi:pyruvate dehydrogenase E2 component (dihydrolipoamide acetyltransferase)
MTRAITMPKWGLTMTEGKVVRWSVPPGGSFSAGDELLEIETSKITNVVEAEGDGTLLRVVAPEGATLPIGALLAVTGPAGTSDAEVDAYVAGFEVVAPVEGAEDAADEAVAPREIEVAGQRLRYLDMGSGGVPALLLHGFGADLNGWMFTQPALAEDRRVVALDLPGHGGSGRDVGVGDVGALVGVVEAFLGALGIDAVHVIGHSMGGGIGLALAKRRPDMVRSLSLIAPAGLGPEVNGAFIEGFVKAGRRRDAEAVLRLLVHDAALISRAMVEDVLRFKRLDGVSAALEAIAGAWFGGGRQQWIVTDSPGVPTQVIWGREDQIIPVAQAAALTGVAVHVLEGAGHLPHMEKAHEVNRLIGRWMNG